uniref:Rev protein n=1 Tax=Equine infectious anemia virus TaxID=11665 RepID=A0A5J6SED8_9RETR|nr:rev protein [Equine infectious anemia virus]
MAEGRDPRYQEDKMLTEDKEDNKRRNDWWKIGMDSQKPLDNDEWCRVLRQSLPEGKVCSQTCIARRALGPGPVQSTPSRSDRWIRQQILHAEGLQETLEWRIRGVQQTAAELERTNKAIWRELQSTRRQHGDYSSYENYKRKEETRWGEPSPRIPKSGDSKRRRKHL